MELSTSGQRGRPTWENRCPIRRRLVGTVLFLAVTAIWVAGIAAWETGRLEVDAVAFWIAFALSTGSVVLTGYLGRTIDALWLGWIPGAAMTATGWALTPTPGEDETGWTSIFFGALVLLGWPAYFFPLIALGGILRARREQR
jgi:hypothetical protein